MPRVIRVPPKDFDPALLAEPAAILRQGGLVAFPTETVYGIGVAAKFPDAVTRLSELKRRPVGKPYSYHLADVSQVADIVDVIPPLAKKLLDRYCPGPITLVLPTGTGAERRDVGVRVPANEIARKLIELVGSPLLVPSANPSGDPPALSAEEVVGYFGDEIDAVVDGGTALLKQASTVVKVDEQDYEVLREGIISREMVHQILVGRRFLFVCTGNTCRSPMAQELFRKLLAERLGKSADDLNELGYRIHSAGTFAQRGGRPSEHAVEVLQRRGCDLTRHRSQPLSLELLKDVDRVFAMGRANYEVTELMLEDLPLSARPRLEMLREDGFPDPVGGDLEEYAECADEIEMALAPLVPS